MRPGIRPAARSILVLAMLAVSTSCGWVRLPAPGEMNPPPEKLLQVWSQGNKVLVRDLRSDGDTLRGLVRRAGYCENCMFSIARDQVDSIRVAPEIRIDSGLVLGVVVVLLWAFLIHAAGGA